MDYQGEFPLKDDLIHLNHAAVSPWPQRTVKAVHRFAEENGFQGSLAYPDWVEVEHQLRKQFMQLLNAPSVEDLALVKNTSEALSFIAYGLPWRAGDNIVSSAREFPSNRIVWESLSSQGVELRLADLDSGESPEDALFALVDENTRLIAISSVQYAGGLRMDLNRIGEFCREHDILFCVDAIQSIGAISMDVQECHADFVAADGHKWMMGPEGLGVFYCRAELRDQLRLTQYGWHMVEDIGNFDAADWSPAHTARRFECGSPNMMAVHALNASLSLLLEIGMDRISTQVLDNSEFLMDRLTSLGMQLYTPRHEGRYAGIVSFSNPDFSSQMLFERLTNAGIFCALRGGNIRFSPHFYTPRAKLQQAIDAIAL